MLTTLSLWLKTCVKQILVLLRQILHLSHRDKQTHFSAPWHLGLESLEKWYMTRNDLGGAVLILLVPISIVNPFSTNVSPVFATFSLFSYTVKV